MVSPIVWGRCEKIGQSCEDCVRMPRDRRVRGHETGMMPVASPPKCRTSCGSAPEAGTLQIDFLNKKHPPGGACASRRGCLQLIPAGRGRLFSPSAGAEDARQPQCPCRGRLRSGQRPESGKERNDCEAKAPRQSSRGRREAMPDRLLPRRRDDLCCAGCSLLTTRSFP